MRIAVESATMADQKYFPILDVLLVIVESRRHGVAVENLEEMFSSPWFARKSRSDRELLQGAALARSHDALLDKSIVVIDANARSGGSVNPDRSETRVHPLDAISFLAIPFSIIVENEGYDGAFLLWMARAVRFDKFVEAYREGRFSFRHAGGKGGLVRSAEILSHGIWPRRDGAYARAMRLWCCAVLDNDARFPGDDPNGAIIESLIPHVAFVHQLALRAIESYLPFPILLRFDNSAQFKKRVDALSRLPPPCRKHYDMKRGFKFKDGNSPTKAEYMAAEADIVSKAEKTLYNGVAEADWPLLSPGFGKGLSRIYYDEAYRPTDADRSVIGAAEAAELKMLLSNIYSRC